MTIHPLLRGPRLLVVLTCVLACSHPARALGEPTPAPVATQHLPQPAQPDASAAAAPAPVPAQVATPSAEASAPAPSASAAAPPPPTIIDLPTDEATYADAVPCISMRELRSHIVLDDRHIVFELRRGRYVLSQFRQRCEYLRQQDTIALHAVGGGARLCAMDQVSVLESNPHVGRATGGYGDIGGFTVIGRCFLGPFEEITKEQLAGLRDAMKTRQRDDDSLWDWIRGK